jgi:hypothetical protein
MESITDKLSLDISIISMEVLRRPSEIAMELLP